MKKLISLLAVLTLVGCGTLRDGDVIDEIDVHYKSLNRYCVQSSIASDRCFISGKLYNIGDTIRIVKK